ncbi:MAG TPA: PilZ domain-containing protein [Polyangiaceae bacterium]|nr:PilZ domain-containing protein [Polyangiaceae bacterium]
MLSLSVIRRSPPPPSPTPTGLHAQRRAGGGARREATERVTLRGPNFETHGWTLNMSRGGVRAIVEEAVTAGGEYVLLVGDDESSARKVSVVWVQDEADGQIVGLRFLDVATTEEI